jgi:hypothetical protein
MQITYVRKKFGPAAMSVIAQANTICADYQAQGYDLTLRQLYYQFVSRDLIPNKQSEYKRLGKIIADARLAGLLDWDYIVDRTRNVRALDTWDKPSDLIKHVSEQFRIDKWEHQPYRVEVWIEKDALVGVIERVCNANQVAFFSCRGYTSQSEVWGAAQRLGEYLRAGQDVEIIHLGDHDPSGIDMTRDIEDRLRLFTHYDNTQAAIETHREWLHEAFERTETNTVKEMKEVDLEAYQEFIDKVQATFASYGTLTINRIALNMDQIEEYSPPPNPAKLTDSRAEGYIAIHGNESWELDALEPTVLGALIQDAIDNVLDHEQWDEDGERQQQHRAHLSLVSDSWTEVVEQFAPDEAS